MIEDVLIEIRTAVDTYLPAELDVEDAQYAAADVTEFGVAIVLEDIPAASVRFEANEEIRPFNLPELYVLPTSSSTVESPWMTTQTEMSHQLELSVVIADIDQDPERLARRMFRTLEALRRVLTERVEGGGTVENPTFQVDILSTDFQPLFELEVGGLVKSATLTIEAIEVETRP